MSRLALKHAQDGQQIMPAGVLLHAVAQCGQKGGKLLLNRDFDPGFGKRFLFLLRQRIRQRWLDFLCLNSLHFNRFIRICRCRFHIRLHFRIRSSFRVCISFGQRGRFYRMRENRVTESFFLYEGADDMIGLRSIFGWLGN